MTRIRVSIDRLVLKGFEPGQRKPLVEALQSELSRMLADPASGFDGARSHRTPVLRLGRMPIAPGESGSRTFGGKVAQGIGKGLKP
jgi:hypothetical protein